MQQPQQHKNTKETSFPRMPIITHFGVMMLYAIMSNPKTNMRKVTETNRSSPFHLPVLVLQGTKLEDPIPQVTHYMARALINPKPKKIYM